jgi:hypothetical protein
MDEVEDEKQPSANKWVERNTSSFSSKPAKWAQNWASASAHQQRKTAILGGNKSEENKRQPGPKERHRPRRRSTLSPVTHSDLLSKCFPPLGQSRCTLYLKCMSDYRRGFALVIGLIEHLQIVTTSNYSNIADIHNLQFTILCNYSFQFVASSPFVAW